MQTSGRKRICGVVLAAGRSSRMGRPKQLLPVGDGASMVQTVTDTVRPCVDELVVVVGHVAGQVAAVLAADDVSLAVNDNVDRGMLSSVQAGVRHTEAELGYLICLADQPSISATVISAVVEAARQGAGIVIPTIDGRRGHPVFIARRYRNEILQLDPEQVGLNQVTRAHPEDTVELAMHDELILQDIDTPAQYAAVVGART